GLWGAGPEVDLSERVRVQAAPVDFNAEQFLQTNVTEMDVSAKVIQQGKLAWLVGRFEDNGLKSERRNKPVCVCRIQVAILMEQPDSPRAFPGFDDELQGAGVEPLLALVDPRRERLIAEPPVVFLAELHLHIEAAAVCGSDDFSWIEMALRETLT